MSQGSRFFLRPTKLLLVFSAFLALGVLALWWARAQAEEFSNDGSQVSSSETIPSYKQRVRIWIHGDGVRPRIMHAKPGVVLLTCENKTLLDAELVVERVLPTQPIQAVGAIAVTTQRGRGTKEFLLAEGEYVVYERSRPELKAKLVVGQ